MVLPASARTLAGQPDLIAAICAGFSLGRRCG